MQRRLVARTFDMMQWKRWVFSRFLKAAKVSELTTTTLSGSEFQMVQQQRKHSLLDSFVNSDTLATFKKTEKNFFHYELM